jgi:hypothetical protein
VEREAPAKTHIAFIALLVVTQLCAVYRGKIKERGHISYSYESIIKENTNGGSNGQA